MKKMLVCGIVVTILCALCVTITTTICASSADNYPSDQELLDAYIQAEWGDDYYGVVRVEPSSEEKYVCYKVHENGGRMVEFGQVHREWLFDRYYAK